MLCPNYRGSTGYGDKFVTDLIGNENDIEVKDILAGIQHLIKEGIADPERIARHGLEQRRLPDQLPDHAEGPAGEDQGGAAAGRASSTRVAEWGFNDEPAYPMVFKKGLPWETPDIYQKTSPTYGLGQRDDADADPRRRQRRALPAGPQPDAVPGPEGVP